MAANVAKTARQLFFAISLITLTSSGCGYSTGSLLPSHLNTIYVDNFKNKINVGNEVTAASRYTLYRPGLENDVTRAIENRFVFDGNLSKASKENADLILTGNVISYVREALRYDSDDNIEEYRIRITVYLEAKDISRDEVMWAEKSFSGEATYMTIGRFATSEDIAREEAVEDLARRVVERTVELW